MPPATPISAPATPADKHGLDALPRTGAQSVQAPGHANRLTPERVRALEAEIQVQRTLAAGRYPRDGYMSAALGAALVVLVTDCAGSAAGARLLALLDAPWPDDKPACAGAEG